MPGPDKKKESSSPRFSFSSLTQLLIPTSTSANVNAPEIALKELAFSVAGLNAATVKDSPDLDLKASMQLFAIDGVRRHKIVVDYGKGTPDTIINPTAPYAPEAFLTELNKVPESWLNIVCRCRQNVYTCHLIGHIHEIFNDAGMTLTKPNSDEQNCHNNFEIIAKIETGEIVFIETNKFAGINNFKNDQYYATSGYIKTMQVFNLEGEYSRPPIVKLNLADFALDMAEKTLKEKSEHSPFEDAFLRAVSPLSSAITSLFSTTSQVLFGASSSTSTTTPTSLIAESRSAPVLSVSMASSSSMPAAASTGALTVPLQLPLESKPLSPG